MATSISLTKFKYYYAYTKTARDMDRPLYWKGTVLSLLMRLHPLFNLHVYIVVLVIVSETVVSLRKRHVPHPLKCPVDPWLEEP